MCIRDRSLEESGDTLTGLHLENPKKATSTPTCERLLRAFSKINLTIVETGDSIIRQITPLSHLQTKILKLMGMDATIYSGIAELTKPLRCWANSMNSATWDCCAACRTRSISMASGCSPKAMFAATVVSAKIFTLFNNDPINHDAPFINVLSFLLYGLLFVSSNQRWSTSSRQYSRLQQTVSSNHPHASWFRQ